jgi:hypothetical protein
MVPLVETSPIACGDRHFLANGALGLQFGFPGAKRRAATCSAGCSSAALAIADKRPQRSLRRFRFHLLTRLHQFMNPGLVSLVRLSWIPEYWSVAPNGYIPSQNNRELINQNDPPRQRRHGLIPRKSSSIVQTKRLLLTAISKATPRPSGGCQTQIKALPTITIHKARLGA